LEPIIETRELCKSFKSFKAVNQLSFAVNKGDVYGFLGENGAGKSTTMRMLLGLIFPDSGKVLIDGTEFSNSRRYLLRNIGAIIERPDMYGYLSGWDNLKLFAALSDKQIKASRLHEVLEIVGLRGRENDKVKAYSQGMKQRLGIAIALVHNPALLMLDEPTNGLDPQGIAEMRALILRLNRDFGTTIMISSHLLYEIEQVASHMLIIHKGKKMAEGKVSNLLNPDDTLVEFTLSDGYRTDALMQHSPWKGHLHSVQAGQVIMKINPSRTAEINNWMVNEGIAVSGIRSKHSLEDYFLFLTNDTAASDRTL
jgi:ABC-type multidrug transport system ATPase subunit